MRVRIAGERIADELDVLQAQISSAWLKPRNHLIRRGRKQAEKAPVAEFSACGASGWRRIGLDTPAIRPRLGENEWKSSPAVSCQP